MHVSFGLVLQTLLAGTWMMNAQVLVGRLMDVTTRQPKPAAAVRVTILSTQQEVISNTDGIFEFTLSHSMTAGSQVQISVGSARRDGLCLYSPRDGVLTVPDRTGQPIEVDVVDCSFAVANLSPAEIEEALGRLKRGSDLKAELKKLARRKGVGLEKIKSAVESWAREVEGNPNSTARERELLGHFRTAEPSLEPRVAHQGLASNGTQQSRLVDLDFLTLAGDFDIYYRYTNSKRSTGVVGRWDARAELWLPPSRPAFAWGPYITASGIGASRPELNEDLWTAAPGLGFQIYPLSFERLSSKRAVRALTRLRLFAEYNRISSWGEADRSSPRKQSRYGLEYLNASGVNSLGSRFWMETWNNFQWISANEVDPKFDSWLLTNRSSFGVRSKLRSKISTFTPFLCVFRRS